MKTICTECPERCILTENDRTCAKSGNKIWLDRNEIICRTCPNIEETCYECIRTGNTDIGKNVKRGDLSIGTWDEISSLISQDYFRRHPEKNREGKGFGKRILYAP